MKIKRIMAACLALALAFTCCACSSKPKTPEQVLEKMHAALAETPCGQAQMVMDMAMTLDGGAYGTLEMSTRTTSAFTISQSPISAYTTATVDVAYGEEKSQRFTENYAVMEEGQLVSYIHSDGVWLKLSTGQTAEGLAGATSPTVDASTVAIDETITEYNGKEVICLTSQVTGDAVQAALGGMLDNIAQQGGDLEAAAETAGAIDYTAMTCDARIYLDKNTYLPIAEEMTFSGMEDVLNPLYEQMGITVAITSCTAFAEFSSYDAQEEIKLPDGAAEKAEIWSRLLAGEPDNGDGTYTIREGSCLVDITAPEGFELDKKDYDHVYFKRDDNREVRYTVYYTAADNFTTLIDIRLNRYGDLPSHISREQMTVQGDILKFDVDVASVSWQSYEEGAMSAWAKLGNDGSKTYYILVELEDGYNDGLGGCKSVDVTPDEFMAYLNAAAPSDLLD